MKTLCKAFVEKQVNREKPGGARDDNTEDTDHEDEEDEEEEGDSKLEGKEDGVDDSDDEHDKDKGEKGKEEEGVTVDKVEKEEGGRKETEKDNQELSFMIDKSKTCSESSTLSTTNRSIEESTHNLSSKQPFTKSCDILSSRLSEGLSGETIVLEVDSEDVISLGSRDTDGEEDDEIECMGLWSLNMRSMWRIELNEFCRRYRKNNSFNYPRTLSSN